MSNVSALRAAQAKAAGQSAASAAADPAATDLAYSERFAAAYGESMRHVRGRGWLTWDAQRWADGELQAQRGAKAIAGEAVNLAAASGERAAIAAAARMCAEPRIRGMLALAASATTIAVGAHELDADARLLNACNGTIDLATGTLVHHEPRNLLTKLAGAAYDPAARSERWDACVAHATGADAEYAAYLQRAAGYTAVGVTDEEVLFFAQGPGASSKTTVLEAISAALGDYARTCDFATFLAARHDADGPTPGIARLAGARMAVASEVSGGQRFNTARLKRLTGGERVVARHLHREPFEFVPQFTLWLGANERPSIAADDDAAWRRIRLLPFVHVVPAPQRDPALKRTLVNDPRQRAAVLAWVVAGAVQWHDRGLGTCTAVERATAAYRDDNDPVAEWLASCCELDADATAMAGALRASYMRFCELGCIEPCSPQEFAKALAMNGLHKRPRSRAGIVWQGARVHDVHDVHDRPGTSHVRAHRGEFPNGAAHPAHHAHAPRREP